MNNSQLENSPEYNQPWKSENNSGCCPSCYNEDPPVCTTVTQYFTRESRDPSLVVSVTNPECPCQSISAKAGCPVCQKPINNNNLCSCTSLNT